MSRGIPAAKVFAAGQYPEYTFVERRQGNQTLSSRVSDALDVSGTIVALVGPSKSGKTQLLRRALGDRRYIRISCSEIEDSNSLVQVMLRELDVPEALTQTVSKGEDVTASGKVGGEANFVVGKVAGHGELAHKTTDARSDAVVRRKAGLGQLVRAAKAQDVFSFWTTFIIFHRMDCSQSAVRCGVQLRTAFGVA